jgi:hypothetical protein
MADEWYCEIAGREVGPLSSQQLRTMAAKGQIWPNDRVRRGEQAPWLPAQNVKGLFSPAAEPAAPRAPAPPSPPPPPPPPPPTFPSPIDIAEPVAIHIATDSPDDRGTRTGAELAAFMRAKRRQRQQRTLVISLVVTIVGLAIAGLLLALGGPSGSTPSKSTSPKKAQTKKADADSRDALKSREGDDLLAPTKSEKRGGKSGNG